ncbi:MULTISPECIES: hypothetical protein [Nostocales]|uniref:Uncharacterized protein n=3 Tax=Nostocales TaxID=1161 RepID=A0A0C1N6U6_9CYAN|nr:hypothetical protein [Tolypothrix bouteillei]KAF3885849.1 hypothetical protein DA73_0400010480 [Tolypothrix bouteillei VB521301]
MMSTIPLYIALLFYVFMAFSFFQKWLDFFIADAEMTSEERVFSTIILVMATVFWPIVVPFAYLEVLKFHQKHKEVIDSLLASSNSRLQDK